MAIEDKVLFNVVRSVYIYTQLKGSPSFVIPGWLPGESWRAKSNEMNIKDVKYVLEYCRGGFGGVGG